MKNIVLLILLITSCSTEIKVGFMRVNEYKTIEIKNHLYCKLFYEKDLLIIEDENKINKLIELLNKSEEISHPQALNMNYGVLNIYFHPKNNKAKTIKFSIIFTLYNGVIVQSLEDGKIYKNDLLEEEIRNYF